jgi:hypothetical protein
MLYMEPETFFRQGPTIWYQGYIVGAHGLSSGLSPRPHTREGQRTRGHKSGSIHPAHQARAEILSLPGIPPQSCLVFSSGTPLSQI